MHTLLAPHSRGGFVLQVGYFKATGRFFPADCFLAADCAYVQQHYHLGDVEWARYDKATRFHHREQILQQFGVLPFEQAEAAVRQQVTHFAYQQMNPVAVFHSAADYIRTHRWEVPTYAALASLITEAFRTVKQHFITQLAHHLTPAVRQQLDALFTTLEEALTHLNAPTAHPVPLSTRKPRVP